MLHTRHIRGRMLLWKVTKKERKISEVSTLGVTYDVIVPKEWEDSCATTM